MLPPPGPASPVPANRVPSGPMAMAPIGCGLPPGQLEANVAPPSTLFHTPPVAAAAYSVFATLGSAAMSRIRPPMFVGPIECHGAEDRAGSRAAVSASTASAWTAALAGGHRGTPENAARCETIQSSGGASRSEGASLWVGPVPVRAGPVGGPLPAITAPTRSPPIPTTPATIRHLFMLASSARQGGQPRVGAGAEQPVPEVAQPGKDVALLVQVPVQGCGEQRDVGVLALHLPHALWGGHHAHEDDLGGLPLRQLGTPRLRRPPWPAWGRAAARVDPSGAEPSRSTTSAGGSRRR